MKNYVIIIFMLFITVCGSAQTLIENPECVSSNVNGKVTKVELLSNATVLYFDVWIRPGLEVYIPKESYIKPVNGEKMYFATHAKGVTLGEKFFVPESGNFSYAIHFPKLPKDVKAIDFDEYNVGEWEIKGLNITPAPVPDVLVGDWMLGTDSISWEYSFLQTKVLAEGKEWEYGKVEKEGEYYRINLINTHDELLLVASVTEKGIVKIGTNKSNLVRVKKDEKGLLSLNIGLDKKEEYLYFSSENGKQYWAKGREKDYLPAEVSSWINKELAKVQTRPIESFNTPDFLKRSKGKIIGYLRGYDASLGFTTGIIYMGNVITREDFPVTIKIYPDGRFEVEIPMISPLYFYLAFNDRVVKFYLEPGQTLAMEFDIIELLQANRTELFTYGFKAINYKGPLAQINNELLGYTKKPVFASNYATFQKKLLSLSPEEYKTERLLKQREELVEVDAYAESNSISGKAHQILREAVILDCGTNLFDFVMNREYKARNAPDNELLQKKEKIEYYDFLTEMPLNNQSLLMHNDYNTFINRFEFCNPLSIYPKTRQINIKPEKNLLEYFEEEGIEISADDKALYSLIINEPTKVTSAFLEKNKAKLEAFNEKYKESITVYSKKYIKPLKEMAMDNKISLDKWLMRDSVLTNTLRLDKSLTYEITKIRSLEFEIKRSTKESAQEYWSRQKKNITHPFLIEEGDWMVKKIFPDLGAKSYGLPSGKGSDVFNKIIAPFKGKILFVNFWATSCAPCISGINGMRDIREKYNENEVFDFIFITDERSSPIGRYNDFVKEQELKHSYRLPRDDYNYLREVFNFNGIPRYVVIDKEGKVINDNFSMCLFESELKKILEENR